MNKTTILVLPRNVSLQSIVAFYTWGEVLEKANILLSKKKRQRAFQ
jgi:hypothetical protein